MKRSAFLDSAAIATSRRTLLRDSLEQRILLEAEKIFAEKGFDGASVSAIAEAAGISKQNLMYYFSTKQELYEKVLHDVLDDWLSGMSELAHSEMPACDAVRAYIRAKLDFSQRRPAGSRVYAMEIIGGAHNFARQIQERVIPALRQDIAVLNRWLGPNRQSVSAEHLMFIIWSSTQSYADFAAQMRLVLGVDQLSPEFFAQAQDTLTSLVLCVLQGRSQDRPD